MKDRASTLLLASLALSPACSHSAHYSSPPTYFEQEINDDAWNANFVDYVDDRSHWIVRGDVQSIGPDRFDGFAFVAEEPMVVEFELVAFNVVADLDVCVYDPVIDEFVACYESPWDPETGSFTILEAGQEFHLVVESFAFDAEYRLDIWGSPLSLAHAAPGFQSEAAEGSDPARAAKREAYKKNSPTVDLDEDEAAPARTLARGVILELNDDGELEQALFRITDRGELFARKTR